MTSTMTSTINGDMEFGSDGFPTDEEYGRREIKLGGPVIYCGGGRWMLAEEVANCNDCETPLDHIRDGTTEEGQRCNNCYWEGQGGRDAAEAIITPDYRIIRVEFGEIESQCRRAAADFKPQRPPRSRHRRPTETNQAAASSAWPRRTARHPWFRSNPSMSAYFNTDLPLPP